MNTPPDLDPDLIRSALAELWGFDCETLDYAQLGFGSHHWIATSAAGARRFVTVDDLVDHHLSHEPEAAYAGLDRAFRSARALRDGGLEFVVAPLAHRRDGVLARLDGRYCMTTLPLVSGRTRAFGAEESETERRLRRERFDALHRATALVQEVAGRESFAITGREVVERSLLELDAVWTGGPYAEPARELLREMGPRLRAALGLHDRLVARVVARAEPWVITHGEPHHANAIWTDAGPQLIDWDTALIAPAARDLWMFEEPRPGADPALSLYRLRWDLRDIAAYLTLFRRPHGDTEDAAKSWRGLRSYADLGTYRRLAEA